MPQPSGPCTRFETLEKGETRGLGMRRADGAARSAWLSEAAWTTVTLVAFLITQRRLVASRYYMAKQERNLLPTVVSGALREARFGRTRAKLACGLRSRAIPRSLVEARWLRRATTIT
jgi:hypothetical protein